MATNTASTEAQQRRMSRAQEEEMTARLTNPGEWIMSSGQSDSSHVVTMGGGEPQDCTCPDAQFRDATCKHQLAIAEWELDTIIYSSGIEVDL